jgi:hypothetical protein
MPLGRLGEPGPGLMPLIVGVLMGILSIISFISSLKLKTLEKKTFWGDKRQWYKVFTTSLALIIYALALNSLGFIFVTLCLMLFLFRVIGELNWKISLGGPILTTSFFYVLFKVWLEVPFPMGPFGG